MSFVIAHPILSVLIPVAAVALFLVLYGKLRGSVRRFLLRLRQGLAILKRPRDYFTKVVPWQAVGRVIRFGSIAAFMAAFALPVTFQTVLLVMAAYGGTRIIPIAPASTGLRIILLSYGLVELTGRPVDVAEVSAFAFGVGAIQLISGLLISMGILLATLGSVSPRAALRAARTAFGKPLTPRSERVS